MPTSVPVKLTFEGDVDKIKPASSTTGVLTSVGDGIYNYTPDSSGDRITQTIKLDISGAEAGDNVKVTLSAAGYNEDGASAEGTLAIVIPSGKLKGLSRNTNYILYSSDPQNKQNPDNQIASFMTNNNSTNSSDILITQPVSNDKIYIRYTKNGRYNVASFSLSDALDNDGVTFNNRSWTEYK